MSIEDLKPRRSLASPEDAAWFWSIVDGTANADEDEQLSRLRSALQGLPDPDLIDFIGLFGEVQDSLYTWRLWAAAYLINGGCGDDGFTDFRSWLISRGRAVATRALADPDSLAALEVEMEAAGFEDFAYVMLDVFGERAKTAAPSFTHAARPEEPADPDWRFDFDDEREMRRRLPRLAASYLV